MKTRIMLTGAEGMIGSSLKAHLKKNGYDVTEFQGECCNWADWEKYDKSYDFLIHLAAFAGVRDSVKDPDRYFANNVGAAGNAFIWANQFVARGKILYASSSNAAEWWSNPYAMTKKANEVQAIHYNAIGMRFHTVWPGRDDMLFRMLERGEVKYINESHTRDFIHVDDVCDVIELIMETPMTLRKPAYDIGTGKGNVVEALGKLSGWEGIEVTDGDPCEAQDNTADISELQKLGWEPTIDVEEYLISKTVPN